MQSRVETDVVQNPKISVSFSDTGDLEHQLTFKCVLKPGDTDRLIHMFKERVQYGTPITLAVSSPQARFDLKMTAIEGSGITKKKGKQEQEPEPKAGNPLTFFKVELSIQKGEEHPYRVTIDDIYEGEGDGARDAAIVALLGSTGAGIPFRMSDKDEKIVPQLSQWLRDNYPVTEDMGKLIYVLEHDSFEVPVPA